MCQGIGKQYTRAEVGGLLFAHAQCPGRWYRDISNRMEWTVCWTVKGGTGGLCLALCWCRCAGATCRAGASSGSTSARTTRAAGSTRRSRWVSRQLGVIRLRFGFMSHASKHRIRPYSWRFLHLVTLIKDIYSPRHMT